MSFFYSFIFLILLNGFVQAHPGVGDKNGCHVDSDTGHRHCHEIKKISSKKRKSKTKKTQLAKKKSRSSVQ